MSGVIIYEGPSMLDGAPIFVAAVSGSKNKKTGGLVQTYIMRSDIPPTTASKTGEDCSVCGDCPHRGVPTTDPKAKQAKKRPCYVVLGQGPTQVFKAYKAGKYKRAQPTAAGADRDVRLGTYGDPAAAPVDTWERLLIYATGWTGYTHQWRTAPELRDICMASADSLEQAQEARAKGWRTFRITPEGEAPARGEITCPADGGVQCQECMLCGGATVKAKSIAIAGHGAGKKYL